MKTFSFALQKIKLLALAIITLFSEWYLSRAGLIAYASQPFNIANYPSVQDLNRYMVQNPGALQVTHQPLYDTVLYPAVGANQLTFFTQPVGQGQTVAPGALVNTPKTLSDTNMQVAGVLPRFQSFLISSVELIFLPGSVATATLFANDNPAEFNVAAAVTAVNSVNDSYAFYNSGNFQFDVTGTNLLQLAPLRMLPPKTLMNIDAAFASNSATVGTLSAALLKMSGQAFMLDPAITLAENASFVARLNWSNLIAMPSGFNGSVKLILDGYQVRATL